MSLIGVVGITVENRADNAEEVQKIITLYGDSIISRMGVPSPDRFTGVITIAMESDRAELDQFVRNLQELDGVSANYCVVDD